MAAADRALRNIQRYIQRYNLLALAIRFLSMPAMQDPVVQSRVYQDLQGEEYDVVIGSKKVLRSFIIVVEAEFEPSL